MIGNNPFFYRLKKRAKKQNGQPTHLIHFHKTMQPKNFPLLDGKGFQMHHSHYERKTECESHILLRFLIYLI